MFENEIDNYINGKETNPYGAIGSVADSYIQGKTSPSYKVNGGVAGSLSGNVNTGNFLNKYGNTLFGALGGMALGSLDNANRKNLIKASYYKNPYLTAALTPEYSLNDRINNLMGTYGMFNQGGPGANIGGKISNLFNGSLVNSLKGLFNKKTTDTTVDPYGLARDLNYGLDSLNGEGVLMSGDNNPPIIVPTTQEEDRFV